MRKQAIIETLEGLIQSFITMYDLDANVSVLVNLAKNIMLALEIAESQWPYEAEKIKYKYRKIFKLIRAKAKEPKCQ